MEPFQTINAWQNRDDPGGPRLPYQPLLVLYALGRWARGERTSVRYVEAEGPLGRLMSEFGPPRSRYQPELPFWALRSSNDWEVTPDDFPTNPGRSGPTAVQLRGADATGRVTPRVRAALDADPALVGAVARRLLREYFEPTMYEDILSAVGLDVDPPSVHRDPAFRTAVLLAYGSACAVCRVGVRLFHDPVGVEAAHIWSHCRGGPSEVTNGLCLCALHHKLFDRGAFTLTADLRVEVSPQANGSNVEDALDRFRDRSITPPRPPESRPDPRHIAWHRRVVFRG